MSLNNTEATTSAKDIAVRVAARIRPLVSKESREGCQNCLDVPSQVPQIIVRGSEKAFTYDYVFESTSTQDYVYTTAVAKMIKELFKGYNVTILAYGQTGSGKTYTMGTSSVVAMAEENEHKGIIPRAVKDIFTNIAQRTDEEIIIKVSFIELYKENIYDLLNTKGKEESMVEIREDPKGGIKIVGLTEIPVTSLEETLRCLEHGAENRTTGATAMNDCSSRSHAIFSIHIEIGKKHERDNIVSAKFHLVDLAGSERAKKTKAIGERFKEGVNINLGLLALGNVISALGGEGTRGYIPYRDSKLTRLLQDSLGGNSHTLMLACVSPADSNLEETLSTLRYADRARKIKNKPIINHDPQTAELVRLRQQVQQLHMQLLNAQSDQGLSVFTTPEQVATLTNQVQVLEEENNKLMKALQSALEENTNMAEKALMAEMAQDQLKTRLEELKAQTSNAMEVFNNTLNPEANPQFQEQINVVKDLQGNILKLQAEQQMRQQAIVTHELSRHSVTTHTICDDSKNDDSTHEESEQHSPIKDNFGTAFTLRQVKLTEELQELNHALAVKEELMTKMADNDTKFVSMKSTYERTMKDLEEQIHVLQSEREELSQKLRNASQQSASSKISEQRRKRLLELETLLSGLRKKIDEQNKLLRIKEQSELKVSNLKKDIQNMKSVRVKLIRQMKEDNEKFRQWKNQKDREVSKLKEADRKKEYQMVKMERLHNKQQNVLKRKMEEAVSINKRLKDAIAVQKACQERRRGSKDSLNAASRIATWLEGELEVVAVRKQAKESLQNLINDRKLLSEQLNQLKNQLEKEDFSDAFKRQLEIKKTGLERDLELRTAQINDLQVKVVDDSESDNKQRFSHLQTMGEAKYVMQHLFTTTADTQAKFIFQDKNLKELDSENKELCKTNRETEEAIKRLKEKQQVEINRISSEYEDKIIFLLKQLPQVKDEGSPLTDEDHAKRLKFQEDELSRLSHLNDLLLQKSAEVEALKQRIGDGPTMTPPRPTLEESPPKTNDVEVKSGSPSPQTNPPSPEESDISVTDEDESDEEEKRKEDPDWRKTPLFRRIQQLTGRGKRTNVGVIKFDLDESKIPLQRTTSSGDVRCGCLKNNCSSKVCRCRKNGEVCSVSCTCNAIRCLNRSDLSSQSDTTNNSDTFLNSTFNLSKSDREPLAEVSINKKIKLSSTSDDESMFEEEKKEAMAPPANSKGYSINLNEMNFSLSRSEDLKPSGKFCK